MPLGFFESLAVQAALRFQQFLLFFERLFGGLVRTQARRLFAFGEIGKFALRVFKLFHQLGNAGFERGDLRPLRRVVPRFLCVELRPKRFKLGALGFERVFAGGDLLLAPIAFAKKGVVAGAHFLFKPRCVGVELRAARRDLLFELFKVLAVVEGRLEVQLVVLAFAARNAGSRIAQNAHIHGSGGGVGKIEVLIRNKAVNDGARIFPFRLILFGDDFARFRQTEIFAAAAADGTSPIRSDVPVLFQTFERAVKGGLFERILPVALMLDLRNDLVSVLVAVVEGAQNDGIDMPADEVGADRLFGLLFAFFFLLFDSLVRCDSVHAIPPL